MEKSLSVIRGQHRSREGAGERTSRRARERAGERGNERASERTSEGAGERARKPKDRSLYNLQVLRSELMGVTARITRVSPQNQSDAAHAHACKFAGA